MMIRDVRRVVLHLVGCVFRETYHTLMRIDEFHRGSDEGIRGDLLDRSGDVIPPAFSSGRVKDQSLSIPGEQHTVDRAVSGGLLRGLSDSIYALPCPAVLSAISSSKQYLNHSKNSTGIPTCQKKESKTTLPLSPLLRQHY